MRRFFSVTIPSIRPTVIFVVITATIGGLQIFAEPRLFDVSTAGGIGGSNRQFQTTVLYLWEMAFFRRDFGEAAAIAWLLFLLIVIFGLLNFFISRRIASSERAALRAKDPARPRSEARGPVSGQPFPSAPTLRAPRAPRRRRIGGAGVGGRPGFLAYGLLSAVFIGSAYPLWWSFVVGSGTNATRGETLPLIPGGNFIANVDQGLRRDPVLAGARQQHHRLEHHHFSVVTFAPSPATPSRSCSSAAATAS